MTSICAYARFENGKVRRWVDKLVLVLHTLVKVMFDVNHSFVPSAEARLATGSTTHLSFTILIYSLRLRPARTPHRFRDGDQYAAAVALDMNRAVLELELELLTD